jgi:hypothetical protein
VLSAHCVYAIVRREATLAGAQGGISELEMVPWKELAAVTIRVAPDGVPTTMEALLHHEVVVEAVRRQAPALPVRFGTVFRDTTALASALAERYEVLSADLDRLGDKVELSVTALWPPAGDDIIRGWEEVDAPENLTDGARYLQARIAQFRQEEAQRWHARLIAEKLDARLGEHAIERGHSLRPTPHAAVRMTYLLNPSALVAFRAAFDVLRHQEQEVRLLLTGPWPPYSFVTGTETPGAAARDNRFAALVRLMTDAMQAPRLNGRGAHVDH